MTLAPPINSSVLLYREATDMRKSFCGLAGIVREQLQREPTDGTLFLFVNRRRDRIKVLYWDRDGFALWYKRLEQGTFEMIERGEGAAVSIDSASLALLLAGIPLSSPRRKRFRKVG